MLRLILVCLSVVVVGPLACQTLFGGLSNRLSNLRFMALPYAAVSPETGWAFGAAGSYFFNIGEDRRLSYIDFSGNYTLARQWQVAVSSVLYFGQESRWQVRWRTGYHRYPYYYYGQGNRLSDLRQDRLAYTSDNAYLYVQPLYRLNDGWSVGGNIEADYRFARAQTDEQIAGMNQRLMTIGVGALALFDSRDRLYYPSSGLFFKTEVTARTTSLSAVVPMLNIRADYRQYQTLYQQLILAWQVCAETTIGHSVPFYMLPVLGGQDLIRGLQRALFTDDLMVAAQAELRFPIYHALRACVFAGVGDVYNYNHWQWTMPKVGYGAGLRVCLNNDMVNVRFDVARNNLTSSWALDTWSFYLTLKEAF